MTLDDIVRLVGTLGFPIVTALYLLIKFDRTINDLVAEIRTLVHTCQDCQARLLTLLEK